MLVTERLFLTWLFRGIVNFGYFGIMVFGEDVKMKMDAYEKQLEYLDKYHYFGSDTQNTYLQNLSTKSRQEVFRIAVSIFQDRNGLPVTGKVDKATQDLMETPRCGNADIIEEENILIEKEHKRRSKRFAIAATGGWSKMDLTYRITSYPTDTLSAQVIQDNIEEAFRLWAEVTHLTFSPVDTNEDITIMFASRSHGDGTTNSFDGRGGVLAHTFYPAVSPFNGDIHFDDDERWAFEEQSGYDFFNVAVHEIGHALGLAHSRDRSAKMYAYYSNSNRPGLANDDIEGIQTLYGSNQLTTVAQSIDFCSDIKLDAIATYRTFVYAFKGDQCIRIGNNGIKSGFPKHIQTVFSDAPNNLDAALFLPAQNQMRCQTRNIKKCQIPRIRRTATYLFKNDSYYKYANGFFVRSGLISDIYPGVITPIDSAFYGTDSKIYIIKADDYWRFRHGQTTPSTRFPKKLTDESSPFRHLPITSIDDAVLAKNGQGNYFSYVIKDDVMYKIMVEEARVGGPRSITLDLFGCSSSLQSRNTTAEMSDTDNEFTDTVLMKADEASVNNESNSSYSDNNYVNTSPVYKNTVSIFNKTLQIVKDIDDHERSKNNFTSAGKQDKDESSHVPYHITHNIGHTCIPATPLFYTILHFIYFLYVMPR